MVPRFFKTPSELRKWFEKNHAGKTELLVGFYKVGTGKPGITWPQSVDEALCFGWIDGIRRSIDENRYSIRFTPRKPKSIWSAVNSKKVKQLIERGLMKPEGLAAFEKREHHRSAIYAFEQKDSKLTKEYLKKFKANKKAWNYFQSRPPHYRRTATWWVISAKQEQTRVKRLEELIRDSEAGRLIKRLRRPGGSK